MRLIIIIGLCFCILSSLCMINADQQSEDVLEDEGKVEAEGEEAAQQAQGVASDTQEEESGKQKEQQTPPPPSGPKPIGASPKADVTMLYIKPAIPRARGVELPAGKPVKVLIGFTNKHEKDGRSFTLDSLDASFRYPQDFNYYLQNFTAVRFNQEVVATNEASLEYSFTPAHQLAGRPFGLQVALRYHDSDGTQFLNAVFNETVQIIEVDEGFDGETFFMYIFVLAIILLIGFGVYHLVASYGANNLKQLKRTMVGSSGRGNSPVEMGTTTSGDVDFEWLPKHTLDQMKANRSPKQSPRQRKLNRDAAEKSD